jgi:hypothetical protein
VKTLGVESKYSLRKTTDEVHSLEYPACLVQEFHSDCNDQYRSHVGLTNSYRILDVVIFSGSSALRPPPQTNVHQNAFVADLLGLGSIKGVI